MSTRKYSPIKAAPLHGGMITVRDPALLKFGQYSNVQNLRPTRPGFIKRPGHSKLHTVADSTNEVLSLYQFKKQKVSEQHFYAQMSDSDVLEATNNPPTVTTGAFGSEVFSGSASPRPASWGTVQDQLIFTNGVDPAQIYGGTSSRVLRAVVYTGTDAAPDIPEEGFDYSDEVQLDDTSKVVVLDSLGGDSDNFLAVMVPVQPDSFTFDFVTVNGTSSSTHLANIEYGKNDNTWANVSDLVDGTEGVGQPSDLTAGLTHYSDNTTGAPANMADNDINTYCQNFTYIAVDFTTGKDIIRLRVSTFNVTSLNQVKSDQPWFQGSNNSTDGSDGDWTNITQLTSDKWTTPGSYPGWALDETFTNGTSYRWYRISGTSANNNTILTEWEMMESGGTTTFAQDGTISFTAPTDMQPRFMFGSIGYWFRFKFSGALDADVTINTITYSCSWQNIVNIWDGSITDPVEVWTAFTAVDEWSKYAASFVDLSDLPDGRKILLFCTDPIEAVYIDVGVTPNDGGATLSSLKYWDGDSMTSVGTTTDGTDGMKNSGWITFPRQSDVHPVQYQSAVWYCYVYELIFGGADLTTDMSVGFTVRPYFDASELGDGLACASFKSRIAYSFTRYPSLIFISPQYNPQALNGDDYYVIEVGDGRQNPAVATGRFYNELLVWQEEHGKEGGCTTLIQGYSPTTFGKLVLSDRVGIMNSKSWAVIDGVTIETATDASIRSVAVWLSRYGVCLSNGQTIWIISDPIQNYFNPADSDSIRLGYADKMWLSYDSYYQLVRIGLVTGSSATVPNTFLCFDMVDKCWYKDALGQALSCVAEVEGASGDKYILQVGGGTTDGTVYLLNDGNDDVSDAIDSQVTIELNGQGEIITLKEMVMRVKAQGSGDIKLTITADGVTKVDDLTFSMIADVVGQTIKRHQRNFNITGSQISVRLRNNDASTDATLYDLGARTEVWENR